MRIAQIVQQLIRGAGYDLRHYRPLARDPFVAQKQLLAGHKCRSIFDVGAYQGDVAAKYATIFPEATIYAFEPFTPSYEVLVNRFQINSRFQLVNAAVSSQTGESTFHVNLNPATNSLLATGKGCAVAEAITTNNISVRTLSLDDFCESHQLSSPDILKFDIQGNELEALRGARKTLHINGPLLIYTEVLFTSLYENCAQFCDLMRFLKDFDYELFNLYSLFHSPDGRLEFGDALFVSKRLWHS